MLITIITVVRLVTFILMEIFCLNSLIWFYDWSLAEKYIQLILIALYFGSSGTMTILDKIHHNVTDANRKTVAIIEGVVSALITFFMITVVNFSDVTVWRILFLQVFICVSSILTYYRRKGIEKSSK